MREYKRRPRTELNLERTKACTQEAFGKVPTNASLWKGLRTKDLVGEKQVFKWMLMHDVYKVGSHWRDAK
jgi:hypothetical protein